MTASPPSESQEQSPVSERLRLRELARQRVCSRQQGKRPALNRCSSEDRAPLHAADSQKDLGDREATTQKWQKNSEVSVRGNGPEKDNLLALPELSCETLCRTGEIARKVPV